MLRIPALFVLFTAVAACSQTAEGGFQALCDAPSACDACKAYPAGSSEYQEALAAHISATVTQADARETFQALATAPKEMRGEMLKRAAADAGVTSCPLADL